MPAKMTRQEFIEKGSIKYNGKFKYDDVVYIDRNTKVKVWCPIHGYFEQAPREHLHAKNSTGCPQCGRDVANKYRTGNLETFKNKANKIHKNKYDYSEFVYVKAKVKGKIICHEKHPNGEEHGAFFQSPDLHLRGSGCPHCKSVLRDKCMSMTKESFIEEAIDKYGEKFDLSNINFVDHKTPVEIYCYKHKKFFSIEPHLFLRGQNCPDCGRERQGDTWQKDTQQFIEKANLKHNFLYDYNLVEYKDSKTKVPIICHKINEKTGKEHGVFWQKPNAHIQGNGCPKCKGNNPLTDEEFAELGCNVHKNRYTYEHVNYVNSHTPVLITCPIHGDFPQMPYKHINEQQGCPNCAQSKLELSVYDILKENGIEFEKEKIFSDLGSYKYDFYVESKKILIECQGEQHFRPEPHFDRRKSFEYRVNNDLKKYRYAKENGYKLIYLFPKEKVNHTLTIFEGMYDNNIYFTAEEILEAVKKM